MYITMQPCLKSVDTSEPEKNYSCCDILISLADENLENKVPIEIKPTHISKAGWNGNAFSEKQELYDNALIGVKELLKHKNINISKMEPADWDFLIKLVANNKTSRRGALDNFIGGKLKGWKQEVESTQQEQQQ